MATREGSGALIRRAALLLVLAAAGAFASCGGWVSVGPLVQCGVACDPLPGLHCEGSITQYNRAGVCVCAEHANCVNYPCDLNDSGCFISGYNEEGACVCVVRLEPFACGQPCHLIDSADTCDAREFNESGECVCAPAACPCGQVCKAPHGSGCYILNQYNRDGDCACAPVRCPDCEGKPCCSEPCGTECTMEGCLEDGGVACAGFCNTKNECVKGNQQCMDVP